MEFYDNINNNINEFFSCNQYNKLLSKNSDIEIISMFFEEKYDYSNDISKLIIEDKKLFLDIINRFRKIINESFIMLFSYEKIIELINNSLIKNINTDKKIKFNRFEIIIKEYLFQINWFFIYYEELKPQLNTQDLITTTYINDFNWRPNQKEAIDILNKNGLQTGIHCQATGTGKSFIIIKYIDYVKRIVNSNCKIILFTERVNILKDLFDFTDGKKNIKKLEEWKNNNIGDLIEFNIIDRVTIKKKDWIELLNKSNKPTLLVINRAYLTLDSYNNNLGYKKITNLDLIIHDECHSSTSNLCHTFLKYWKDKKVPIVGFSATPLRNGKTEGEFNKDKLIEIFSDNSKLNLLTDYNMIYSIEQELILPPKFYWYNMESYQTYQTKLITKRKAELVTEMEIGSIMSILNEIMDLLPNKKIVAWCGTIELCIEWCNKFNEYKKNLKNIFPEIYKIETFIDNSKIKNNDYHQFKDKNSFSILFCAQKHREGSDIKKLDCCIFLDKVKNRSSIPFIQSIGRVLRIDTQDPNKTCGIIIDGVVKDNEQYEKIFIDKILGYYFALANLTFIEDSENTENKYDEYIKIRDVVKFDKENKIININVGNTTIPINCKKLDWDKAVSQFNVLLEKKVNLSHEESLLLEFNELKKNIQKENLKSNNEYYIYAQNNDLELEPNIKYNLYWTNWYNFLGIDYSIYPTDIYTLIEICKSYKIYNKKKYYKKWQKYNLPSMPEELYMNFSNFESLFEENLINRRIK